MKLYFYPLLISLVVFSNSASIVAAPALPDIGIKKEKPVSAPPSLPNISMKKEETKSGSGGESFFSKVKNFFFGKKPEPEKKDETAKSPEAEGSKKIASVAEGAPPASESASLPKVESGLTEDEKEGLRKLFSGDEKNEPKPSAPPQAPNLEEAGKRVSTFNEPPPPPPENKLAETKKAEIPSPQPEIPKKEPKPSLERVDLDTVGEPPIQTLALDPSETEESFFAERPKITKNPSVGIDGEAYVVDLFTQASSILYDREYIKDDAGVVNYKKINPKNKNRILVLSEEQVEFIEKEISEIDEPAPESYMEGDSTDFVSVAEAAIERAKKEKYIKDGKFIDAFIKKYDSRRTPEKMDVRNLAAEAFSAAKKGNIEDIRVLADNFRPYFSYLLDKKGNNLLHASVGSGDYYSTKYILIKGLADIYESNFQGLTPFDIAAEREDYATLALIRKAYPDIFRKLSVTRIAK